MSHRSSQFALAIAGMVALAAAMGIGRFVYTPILPSMASALAMNQSTMGIIASANFLGYLIGAILAAKPNLPGNPKHWLLSSLMVSALTTVLSGWFDTATALIFIRFLAGISSAFVLVFASSTVLNVLMATEDGRFSSYHFAGVGLGITVSALTVWMVALMNFDWRMMWYASGLIALLALLIVAILVPSEQPRQSPVSASKQRVNAALIRLIIAYGLFGFGYIITATYIVAIVRDNYPSLNFESLIWILVGLCAMFSVALWSKLAGKIGTIKAFSLACGVEAVGVVASVVNLGKPGLMIAAIILGGTFMGITALGLMGARQLSPASPRSVLAWMTASFGLGQIIGPIFAGAVYDISGNFVTSSFTAAAALVLAMFLTIRQNTTAV